MWSKVIAVLMLSLVMLLAPAEAAYTYNDKGLLIVTTFPNLVWDIKQLVCKDDRVKSIVPLGVDPHEYQLTPSDIQLLAKADIIVSTAHTPFEEDIRSLTLEGKLYATLIEIPRIPGIRILRNPVTGQPNYHMLIYDPENYKIF
ncbi:MAG: zinc ABC transporter substrate-binding protein, partial [Pyrodictiaceae archaeon]